MVLGVVFGSFIRSSSVATDSTLALRRCSGLKSNCSRGSSTRLPAATMPAIGEDPGATPHQKPIERGERGIAHGGALSRRTQQREQRRQHGDAGNERDDHAGAGDHAELGHAAIFGRQERIEAGRDRRGGERQRAADFARRRRASASCKSSLAWRLAR